MPQLQSANALDTNARKVATSLLNARVADAIDLALIVKQAHWNLRGPDFIAVHKMLDEFRDAVDEYVDTMAERVSQLGAVALGTSQAVVQSSRLAPYPTDIVAIPAHLKALVERTATVANEVRSNIDEADEAGDAGTADIFTEVSRGLDKWLWFLEAHLQG